jgi:alpha-glucosidase
MPADVMHRVEASGSTSRLAPHAEIHNVYGMQNVRATFEGLLRLQPGERPYVMTRAMFAGTQRYAVTWTGDNRGTWDHLKLSVPMILNLGLSGIAYAGADVGGFAGAPSAELLTRWIEIGAFLPVFRDHYGKGWPGHEPWVDGKAQLDIRRHFIEERYRLLPYWYALADEHARSGAPLVRPVFYEFEAARTAPCEQSTTFLLGASLLVAPPPDLDGVGDYEVCLPGGGWYDYWTGRAVGATATGPALGPQQFKLTPALETLPVYVRAGTILPRQPVVQSTADRPDGPLTLDVYPGAACSGVIYLDDGHSLGYQHGEFLRQRVTCTQDADGLSVDFAPREGRYPPWWRGVRVTVHDAPGLRPAGTPAVGTGLRTAPRDSSVDLVDPVGGVHVRFVQDGAPSVKARL